MVALSLTIWSCSKEHQPKIIETELQEYVDAFVAEAASFDVQLDLSGIDLGAYIQNIEDNGILGQCISYSDGSKEVIINERNWDRMDILEKEYVVFHELGHCVLNRSHDNSKNSNGICRSIMQGGDGQCESRYTENNRTELLEELFKN